MTAQELLEALNEARNGTDLDQVAVWALTKYLQDAWKDAPGKNIRPFDLGQVLSDFFVDLSQHRLPENITKQTPHTESQLLDFFGAAEGSKSQFWMQCIEIWNVALEQDPAYAKEVKDYFDMLLKSSLQGKRLDSPAFPVKPSAEPYEKTSNAHDPATNGSRSEPERPIIAPASPSPVEPPAQVAAEPIKQPERADGLVPAPSEAGSEPPEQSPVHKSEAEPKAMPRNAYLILQGTRIIPLNLPLIKIGRQLDNQIILEDPRISRSHAQIKLINDRFVIFDMNSTGGTFVNGQPISQSVLYPGDVVSLAGVVFIFSQEMPARPGDLNIIELGSPFAADRPTVIVQREEIKPVKKIGSKGLPDLPKTGPLK